MFTWDQGLDCIDSQIIVELVDMQETPNYRMTHQKSCPTDIEFYHATPLSIATMSVD